MSYNKPMSRMARRMLFLGLTLFVVFLGIPLLTLIPFSTSHAPPFSISADDETLQEPETLKVWVTAYSSTPEQTDENPFETAAQTRVRDGIVAANFLPFGSIIKIPEFFGDKLFVVEDRMHARKRYVVDVWMAEKQAAKEFGSAITEIIVVQEQE